MAVGWSALSFTNTNATDTVDLLSSGFALKNFDWSYGYAGDEFPKMGDSGNHKAQSFVRATTFNLVVQILGGTSDSNYWTNRATLVKAFLVDDGAQTAYPHGRITGTPVGGSSIYFDWNITGISIPRDFSETAAKVSTVTITARGDRGYWLATADDSVVRL